MDSYKNLIPSSSFIWNFEINSVSREEKKIDATVTLKKCILILKETHFLFGPCGNNVSTKWAGSPLAFLPKKRGKQRLVQITLHVKLICFIFKCHTTPSPWLWHNPHGTRTKGPGNSSDWFLATQLVGEGKKQESCWWKGRFRGEETEMRATA